MQLFLFIGTCELDGVGVKNAGGTSIRTAHRESLHDEFLREGKSL